MAIPPSLTNPLTRHWLLALVLLLAAAGLALAGSIRLLLAARVDSSTGREDSEDAGEEPETQTPRPAGAAAPSVEERWEALNDAAPRPWVAPAVAMEGAAQEEETAAAPEPAPGPLNLAPEFTAAMPAQEPAAPEEVIPIRGRPLPPAEQESAAIAASASIPAAAQPVPEAPPAEPGEPSADAPALPEEPQLPFPPESAETFPGVPPPGAAPQSPAWSAGLRSRAATAARRAPAPAAEPGPRVSRRREPRPPAPRPGWETPAGPPPRTSGYMSRLLTQELRQSFRGAFRYLADHAAPDSPTHLPLYLLIGSPRCGKTTLLNHLTLPWRWRQTQSTFGASGGMMWKFSEKGILLELPGSYLMDTSEGFTAWRQVIPLLQKHRPRRPLDGVILMLPANLLVVAGEPEAERRQATIATIREQLDRLSRSLSLRLPVYILVSKCDLLPGFAALCGSLPPERRQDVLGWANPEAPGEPFDAAACAEGLQQLCLELRRIQAEAALEHLTEEEFAQQLPLMQRFQELVTSLNEVVPALMAGPPERTPRMLRGIYLYGDQGIETPAGTEDGAGDGRRSIHQAVRKRLGARQFAFIQNVIPQQISPEWGLAAPLRHPLAVRHPLARRLRWTAAVLALCLAASLGWGFRSLTRRRDEHLIPLLRLLQKPPATMPAETLLSEMAENSPAGLRSWLVPPSLLPGVDGEIGRRMVRTLEQVVYPRLQVDLQARGHALADRWGVIVSQPPLAPGTAPILKPEQLPDFRTIQRFTVDWERQQREIDEYQALANARQAATPQSVERFLREMGAPLPGAIPPGSPLLPALTVARGKPYHYPEMDVQRASEEMQTLVRRLFYQWYTGNALVTDLRELARIPSGPGQDLRRTRLSARVREELNDPELVSTITAAGHLSGSLYRVTLGTVHRSGYMSASLREFILNESEADLQQVQAMVQQLRSPLGHPLLQKQGNRWRLAPEMQ